MAVKFKPIVLDQQLHERGERVELAADTVREVAWWIAADLVRRHPSRLSVVEAHPIDIYDCVSIIDKKQQVGPEAWLIHMNLEGHITTLQRGVISDLDHRFNWYEVLKAPDRRQYIVEQLEGSVGLRRLTRTPRTTERSIGTRCIARFAELAATTPDSWAIRAGFGFDSYWPEPYRVELFGAFPSIAVEALRGGDIPEASRFWFFVDPGGSPVSAIDTEVGRGWGWDGDGMPLLSIYHHEVGDLDRVLARLVPPGCGLDLARRSTVPG